MCIKHEFIRSSMTRDEIKRRGWIQITFLILKKLLVFKQQIFMYINVLCTAFEYIKLMEKKLNNPRTEHRLLRLLFT
ncbi:hypothetical protein PsorP6_002771 [Peronosclerospora sorghi]|uniref:Uncharacterized protein n=1 Tax=Peronosclerospora sorghi TaxID=230839 RepID=A0ACC0VK70_9STRA|nr:hypothetical protein PsorP6_002771 [Peronosclerospora sorghi]